MSHARPNRGPDERGEERVHLHESMRGCRGSGVLLQEYEDHYAGYGHRGDRQQSESVRQPGGPAVRSARRYHTTASKHDKWLYYRKLKTYSW